MIKKSNSFFEIIFKIIYYFVIFFVFIGEIFHKPLRFFLNFFLKKIFLFKSKIFNFLREKILIVTTVKLPRIDLPKIKTKRYYTPLKINKNKINNNFYLKLKYFFYGFFFGFIIFLLFQIYFFIINLPSPLKIGKINYRLSTHIYDRNGKLLYEIFKNENRTQIYLKDLPKHVIYASIAIEDKDFYKHKGVNLIGGILRAIKENVLNKNKIQGGSTITQQLVKTSLLSPEKTWKRKIKEIILAIWTERIYTKDQILEMYFNQIAYGGSSYGIEEASRTYFGKSAKDLNLPEGALLAGLTQAPSVYSPYNNPKAALDRRNQVLEAMYKEGYIDKKSKINAQKSDINVLPPRNKILAPHFVFYTKSQLEDYFGIKTVEEGGLKVTTTLDLDIQRNVEEILRQEIEKNSYLNITNGSILVLRPSTGEILAMVGSVDYFKEPWGAFNVTTALRQPGSAIKPLVYALALQKGYTPATIIDDVPTTFYISGSQPYKPVNYDGRFHGKVPFRYALANSYNIPAVKIMEKIGVENFIDYAKKLGISTWKDKNRYGLSLALGGGEVRMIDLAQAFSIFANLGYKIPLTYYLKIEDSNGNVLKEINPFKIKEIDSGIAYIISDILSDNQARIWAFGPGSALEIPGYKVAVKTGTTDNKKDNWTIGYTQDFLVVVWVGNNDGTPMNPYLTSGVTGAAPIWNKVMTYLLKNYVGENRWYNKPENIVEKNCFFGRKEYFIKGTENKVSCVSSQLISPTPTP
ncbi:MAG: PBP1A family penicillin-binding protein [Patescibacteria group bacterium]|nr:PBP1A family penicillin-binding protein [Patescibacteria group bacterium]